MTNAILLPKVMKYNCKGNPKKFAEIAELLGADTVGMSYERAAVEAVTMVEELNMRIGVPDSINTLGVTREMFDDVVDGTMGYRLLWMNPIEFTKELAYKVLDESME